MGAIVGTSGLPVAGGQPGYLNRAAMLNSLTGYWSARRAVASGSTVQSIAAYRGRDLLKMSTGAPTLSASRIVFTNGGASRLIQGTTAQQLGVLQTLRLTASTVSLPDASGSDTGKGFTCTGGVAMPDGTRWVMNFGVPTEGSLATPAPSLVHLSADFTTNLGEITFLSISGTLTTGAQGLAYDSVDGVLVFWAANKFWFVNPTTGALVRSLDFTSLTVNGLLYDPATDMLIACATGNNSTLQWINKTTGALGRTLSIYGTAIDHLCLNDGYLWYSGGDNGSAQGGAIRQVDLSTDRVVGEWFTDAGAPEGPFVSGPDVWLLNDGYYHNPPGDTTNTARHYTLDPPPNTYPGTGRRVVVAGVAKLDTAVGTTTALFSIGEPITSGSRGIGLFFPGSSTTTLRLQVNNSLVNFTVPDTTTEFLYFLDVDYGAAQASLYINGALIATSAIPGLSSVSLAPPMQLLLGACREGASITRTPTFRKAVIMVGGDQTYRVMMEGEAAWEADRSDLLPATHPCKGSRP